MKIYKSPSTIIIYNTICTKPLCASDEKEIQGDATPEPAPGRLYVM